MEAEDGREVGGGGWSGKHGIRRDIKDMRLIAHEE